LSLEAFVPSAEVSERLSDYYTTETVQMLPNYRDLLAVVNERDIA
jgi:hypothetical protein